MDSATVADEMQKLLAKIKRYEEMCIIRLKLVTGGDWGRGYDYGAKIAFKTSHKLITEVTNRFKGNS